jgi:hypothetical protein
MPYFKEKEILFIHIPKNAGMFIEKTLEIPNQLASYRQPKSYKGLKKIMKIFVSKFFFSALYNTHKLDLGKEYLYGIYAGRYPFQHASIEELLAYNLINDNEIKSATILAVHRHPLSRSLSIYKYWGYDKELSFEEFCIEYIQNRANAMGNFPLLVHLKSQVSFLRNTSGISLDKVHWLSFENLNVDLTNFLTEKGLDLKLPQSLVNQSSSSEIHVSEKAKRIVEGVYHEDYAYFGYK